MMMSVKYKLLLIVILVLLVISYVWYSQHTISSLTRENTKLEESVRESTSSLNTMYSLLQTYEDALNEKERILNNAEEALQKVKNQLKGLTDEDSKVFLSTPTPDNVRRMLESTDYYKKSSNSISTSKLSGTE